MCGCAGTEGSNEIVPRRLRIAHSATWWLRFRGEESGAEAVAEVAGELYQVSQPGSLRGAGIAQGQFRFEQEAGQRGVQFAV
jgi:hypothetical protein